LFVGGSGGFFWLRIWSRYVGVVVEDFINSGKYFDHKIDLHDSKQ
jgi:hypothetical protein